MCFFLCNHTSHNGDIPMSSHTLLQLDYRKETVSIKNWPMIHLLQSDRSVYFKVSKESTDDSALKPLKTTGMVVDTDNFWKHRFGSVATRCAGTTEHSLTNWFARYHIWRHFDSFLPEQGQDGRDRTS